VRIGGVAADLPEGYPERCRESFDFVRDALGESDKLLTRNRVFLDRMQGVGRITAAEAISYGYTGPCLRSTGVPYDVRKDQPYLVYGDLDFEVPVGENGDNLDRYLVRMEETRQSLGLCEQALARMPAGDVILDDPRVSLPPKSATYNTIESMINHFKLIVDGIQVPPGEVYGYTEGGNGELGFYIVSDGTGRPYKMRCRPPCFTIVQSLPRLIEGAMIADVVPTFGSLNMIGGECDR
jgi:NADH-quinone oxidoreductase subunit D